MKENYYPPFTCMSSAKREYYLLNKITLLEIKVKALEDKLVNVDIKEV